MGLAQVPLDARGAQHRPGYAELLALVRAENADALQTPHPDAVMGEQLFIFVHLRQKHIAESVDVLLEAVIGFVKQSTDAEGVRG